jgi:hypothetical protein
VRAPDAKVVGAVEVGGLAEGGLGLGGGVADVVAGLEAADEADVGVDFVGLWAGWGSLVEGRKEDKRWKSDRDRDDVLRWRDRRRRQGPIRRSSRSSSVVVEGRKASAALRRTKGRKDEPAKEVPSRSNEEGRYPG